MKIYHEGHERHEEKIATKMHKRHKKMMKKKQKTYLGLRPVFIKRFLRGGVKSLPVYGALLEEIIFGVLDDEAAQAESEKIHKKLDNILSEQGRQETDFAEILLALHIQTDVNEKIQTRLKAIEKSLRDDTDSPIPQYFEKAFEKVSKENREFYEDFQRYLQELRKDHEKLRDDHKQQSEVHEKQNQVLEEIKNALEQLKPAAPPKPKLIHNLPYGSIGGLFKGRVGDFEKLQKHLCGDGEVASVITQPGAVYGLGGIGKTRLAVEFGWRTLEERIFDYVFFVRCGKADSDSENAGQKEEQKEKGAQGRLVAAINELGGPKVFNIEGYSQARPDVLFGKVLCELEKCQKRLVIFDNVDETQMRKEVLGLLPRLSGGKVLVTSRLSAWGGAVRAMEIEKISIEASAEYLLESTEKKRRRGDKDDELARGLAGKLDGLPAALEQAAAYINRERTGFRVYLEEFEENVQEILDNEELVELPGVYQRTVAATWQMTIGKLGVVERVLLCLSAFLGPDEIPIRLFEEHADKIGEAAGILDKSTATVTKKEVHKAVLSLADWSMVKFEAESFSVHRIVQEASRLRMDDGQRRGFCQIMVDILAGSMPDYEPHDVRSWGYWRPMEAHIAAAVNYSEDVSLARPPALLMNNLGLFYDAQARYGEAEPMYRRAVKLYEKSLGNEHPYVATAINNLAALLKDTNRLKEAEPLMKKALKIDQKAFGKDHPNVAIDLNNLAQLLKATNRLKEAEPLYRKALKIDQKAFGNEHPNVAIRLNNLAQLLKDTNRLNEAEPLMKKALKIDQKAFGNEHPNVAIDLNNLAGLLQDTGRLDEAEKMYRRALEIFEESLGAEHPKTKIVRGNWESLKER